jgi:hypothetical protein
MVTEKLARTWVNTPIFWPFGILHFTHKINATWLIRRIIKFIQSIEKIQQGQNILLNLISANFLQIKFKIGLKPLIQLKTYVRTVKKQFREK